MARSVTLTLEPGDVTTFAADVLALKYTQAFHGADEQVAQRLIGLGVDSAAMQPEPGSALAVETRGGIGAPTALWLGMPRLWRLGYAEVLSFGARAVHEAARLTPSCRTLAMTTHGPGFGLDEVEATLSLIAGLRSSVHQGDVPDAFERIVIVERSQRRLTRLREAVAPYLTGDPRVRRGEGAWRYELSVEEPARRNTTRHRPRAESAHAFVAMPFTKEMDDVFFYGIQGPVRRAGLLCERVDQDVFSGDILERIRKRIETAAVIIGDLSGQNPNVYLEVGYAWGLRRPTILSQRCVVYDSIRSLEEKLDRELAHLAASGVMPVVEPPTQ